MSQKPFTWIEKNHLKAKLCCIVNVLLATKMSVRHLSGSMKYIQNIALRSLWRQF